MSPDEAQGVLARSDLIHSAAAVRAAVDRVAVEISQALGGEHPLVLSVMGGAVVFTGHLLTRLSFPMEFDYLHVSRYRGRTEGGDLNWRVGPGSNCAGRTVLVVDDILDEGHTLAAIRDRVLAEGAKAFCSAVLADKDIGRDKPIRADFVGLTVPDRYVFGYGMDVRGAWRNLPEIRALKE